MYAEHAYKKNIAADKTVIDREKPHSINHRREGKTESQHNTH
jgi:hypothetical protein